MLFNSSEFIFVFLPFAVLLHFALARWSVTAAVSATTLTSLLFYAWWNPPFVLLPVLSIAANFLIAQAMRGSDEGTARRLLIIGIVANLAVLGWFKYGDFLLSIVEGRRPNAPEVPLALVVHDLRADRIPGRCLAAARQRELSAYAMFVAFFPHLIAGPIVRWDELGPQLRDRARYRPDWNNIALGLTIFCLGLAKKVLIADSLSPHVGPVFDAAARGEALTAAAAWGAAYAYTAQLYFDFSGYSDMAVGLGLLFNLRLPINFAAPLRATSIIDLWRRWHISLSRFLRDFVYVPLGGAAGGPARRTTNLFLTMVIGGLWHGANWTFVLWGAFHGVLLAVNHAWRQWRGRRAPTQALALRRLGRDIHRVRHRDGAVPRRRSYGGIEHVPGDGGLRRSAARRSHECVVGFLGHARRAHLGGLRPHLDGRQLVGGRLAVDRRRARDHPVRARHDGADELS